MPRYIYAPAGVDPLTEPIADQDRRAALRGLLIWGGAGLAVILVLWWLFGALFGGGGADLPTPTATIAAEPSATPTPSPTATPTEAATQAGFYPASAANDQQVTPTPGRRLPTVQVTAGPDATQPVKVVTVMVTQIVSVPGPSTVNEVVVTKVVEKKVEIPIDRIITATPGPTATPWIITYTIPITATVLPGPTATPWIITYTIPITVYQVITTVTIITATPEPTQTPWYVVVTATPYMTPTPTPTIIPRPTDIISPTPPPVAYPVPGG